MSFPLPRPAPYSTAQPTGVQSPAQTPPPQENPNPVGPSWLPPQQPTGGDAQQQSAPAPNYSQYGPAGMPQMNANGGYGSPVTAWGFNPPPWQQAPSPNPNPPGRTPVDPGTSGGYGGGGPEARGGEGGGFGGGGPEARGAQHPVDLFQQMVQHPHGQAILQSQGWTPPQQPAAQTQPRATPTVPNPGLPPPR